MPLKALVPDPQPTKMKSRKCGLQLAGRVNPTRDTSIGSMYRVGWGDALYTAAVSSEFFTAKGLPFYCQGRGLEHLVGENMALKMR